MNMQKSIILAKKNLKINMLKINKKYPKVRDHCHYTVNIEVLRIRYVI